MNGSLNELDIALLGQLYKSKATFMNGLTIDDIQKKVPKIALKTVYKHVNILVKYGYINLGMKVDRKNRYYVSDEGLKFISNIQTSSK